MMGLDAVQRSEQGGHVHRNKRARLLRGCSCLLQIEEDFDPPGESYVGGYSYDRQAAELLAPDEHRVAAGSGFQPGVRLLAPRIEASICRPF